MTNTKDQPKPVFLTWRALYAALWPLHMDVKADVDRLYDIWKIGAVTPNSIVRNPKGYDQRLNQPGNYEARIVWFKPVSRWVVDVTTRRGTPMTPEDAMAMLQKVGRILGQNASYVQPPGKSVIK